MVNKNKVGEFVYPSTTVSITSYRPTSGAEPQVIWVSSILTNMRLSLYCY